MTLCFFETLALMTFIWWLADAQCGRRGWLRYMFALILGLAVLSKGPVGAILPALACGIFLIVERRTHELRELASVGPVLLTVLVGGSWYAACLVGGRYAVLNRQLGSENLGRFFGTLGAMPAWYYVEPLLLNSALLSLLIPFAVFFVLRTSWQNAAAPPETFTDNGVQGPYSRSLETVRVFAIFWLVSIGFFTLAAYKRRAYLLPLWPASAVMLTWWVQALCATSPDWGRRVRGSVILSCWLLIALNAIYLPRRQMKECAEYSVREEAQQINRIVGRDEALYSYGFAEDPAPLLFYLDRSAPPVSGKLGESPPGYVILPVEVWIRRRQDALDLTPVYQTSSGRQPIVLLRRGRALAALPGCHERDPYQ
jgi:4-amino-4-deoxy-L-arabinose transferase-like glycosyltransferase